MAQSVLERVTELVVARLGAYRMSFNQIVWMLRRTHAHLMMMQRQEKTGGRVPTTAPCGRIAARAGC